MLNYFLAKDIAAFDQSTASAPKPGSGQKTAEFGSVNQLD
jgi:hypothetical protein